MSNKTHQLAITGDIIFISHYASSNGTYERKQLDVVTKFYSKSGRSKTFYRVMNHGQVVKQTGSFRLAVKAYNEA